LAHEGRPPASSPSPPHTCGGEGRGEEVPPSPPSLHEPAVDRNGCLTLPPNAKAAGNHAGLGSRANPVASASSPAGSGSVPLPSSVVVSRRTRWESVQDKNLHVLGRAALPPQQAPGREVAGFQLAPGGRVPSPLSQHGIHPHHHQGVEGREARPPLGCQHYFPLSWRGRNQTVPLLALSRRLGRQGSSVHDRPDPFPLPPPCGRS